MEIKEIKKTILLRDYKPYPFIIEHLDLEFNLDTEVTRVKSKIKFKARNVSEIESMLLNGEHLKLHQIKVNGIELEEDAYELTDKFIRILHMPESGVVEVVTTINPKSNTRLSGLYISNNIYCSQCESEGFRAITFYPDRPDVLSTYTVKVIANKAACPIILSNGNLEQSSLSNDRITVVWDDPFPKPSYLFALIAGDFDVVNDCFTTKSGKKVKLGIYTEPGKGRYASWAMQSLIKSMKWDEDIYQREYDLDLFNIVSVSDFNFGAMENKGLNVFNDNCLLVDEKIATDEDFEKVEAIVAHEYFHNWTGNRITCRDWFQLCLKEGLTVFREQQFVADKRGYDVARIQDVRQLRSVQFPEDQGPLSHPVRPNSYIEINNFYTSTVYDKGAELIRMLNTILSDKEYQKGIQLYFSRHDGEAVTIEDFVKAIGDGCKKDLSWFLTWYYQNGTPQIFVNKNYDKINNNWSWTIEQKYIGKNEALHKPLSIPLSYAIFDGDKGTMLHEEVVIFDKKIQEIKCLHNNLSKEPILSLNRGFTAPIEIATKPDYAFLAFNETDALVKWEALQQLLLQVVKENLINENSSIIDNISSSNNYVVWLKSIKKHLSQSMTKEVPFGMLAMIISIPDQSRIIQQLRPINPLRLNKILKALRAKISTDLFDLYSECYLMTSSINKQPYIANSVQNGTRSLRSKLLLFLNVKDDELALTHYNKSTNMTDRLMSLSILVENKSHDNIINDFISEFKKEPLVTDKINALIARSQRDDTKTKIENIYNSPDFDKNNPNRIISLFGSMAVNLKVFHDNDGWAYDILTKIIIDNNISNPSLAGYLTKIFSRWQDYTRPFSSRQKAKLIHIGKTESISSDVYEIIKMSLKE